MKDSIYAILTGAVIGALWAVIYINQTGGF